MSETTTSTTVSVVKPTVVRFSIDPQCPIQYVTVYNDRAEVTRILQHHFDSEGTYELLLSGFSESVDQASFHVSGGTGRACTILEVSYQTRYENTALPSDLTPLDHLQSELQKVKAEIETHQRELTRLNKQRTWLDGRSAKLMNQDGPCTANDIENMQLFLDFYHRTLLKLDDETTREEEEVKTLKTREEALKKQVSQYGVDAQNGRRKTCREVTIVTHVAAANTDVALEVSYLISNCSWSASYDVRVSTVDVGKERTQLTYYGIITNQSQENWIDTNFSLSTATPSLGGVPPTLNTLRVDYYKYRPTYQNNEVCYLAASGLECAEANECIKSSSLKRMKGSFRSSRAKASLDYDPTIEDSNEEQSRAEINVLSSKAEASMSSTSFVIPRRATIESDGKPHKVTVGVLDLTSKFIYTVVPKHSLHAYLKASTVNTSDKQLLAGPAAIFMDNNFVTKSSIANVCVGDTFDLPLGADGSVKVEFKPVKRIADTLGVISKVNRETVRHETQIVNTKATEITVFVYEQVPQTSNEKIKVKLVTPEIRQKEHSGNLSVTMNDKNNVEWKCILAARSQCSFPLEYVLEWPKEKRIEFTEDK